MEQSSQDSDDAARHVKDTLDRHTGGRRRLTQDMVRSAGRTAARGTRSAGRGAGHLARNTVEGTVRAVGEISGETTAFVRDAVIGVIEGTDQVVSVTKPAVREVVAGAIHGGSKLTNDVGAVAQDAVEGAIVGAASVGMDTAEAAVVAAEAAVEAVGEVGGDLRDVTTATISGVISAVSSTGDDVATAVRDSAATLVDHPGATERSPEEIAMVAVDVLETVLAEADREEADRASMAEEVSAVVVAAAYQVGQSHGNLAREQVIQAVSRHRVGLPPEVQRQLSEVAQRLSRELPQGRAAWRGIAIIQAVRFMFRVGASDRAASLAFFTILSFFPLVALAIISLSLVTDPDTIRRLLDDLVAHFFPASADLVGEAVTGLIDNSAAFSVIALGGLAFSANGLFMAANRALNHVFGVTTPRTLRMGIVEVLRNLAIGIVLLLSIGASVLVQTSIGFTGGELHSPGGDSHVMHTILGAFSALVPAGVTGLVFTVVYRQLPRTRVEWKDAAFGGMVALILFESGKHLFFWLSGVAAQRSVVYGPMASSVVLLMWAYIAGIVFLYGASLTQAAGELRPRSTVVE